VDSQQDADEGDRHGHRKSAQGGGQHKPGQHGGAKSGRRASIDWNKPILDHFEDVKEKYAFDKVLGKGQFGVTRLVVDTATGETCACKSISKRKLVSQEDMEDVRREIKVMHHLSGHPHVVTFNGGETESRLKREGSEWPLLAHRHCFPAGLRSPTQQQQAQCADPRRPLSVLCCSL
jgi:hypothetical protein